MPDARACYPKASVLALIPRGLACALGTTGCSWLSPAAVMLLRDLEAYARALDVECPAWAPSFRTVAAAMRARMDRETPRVRTPLGRIPLAPPARLGEAARLRNQIAYALAHNADPRIIAALRNQLARVERST